MPFSLDMFYVMCKSFFSDKTMFLYVFPFDSGGTEK